MTDAPNSPCCSDQSPCCGAPVPGAPTKRKIWKTILFLLILLIGVAVAAHSLMGKKNACAARDCCSEPCGE